MALIISNKHRYIFFHLPKNAGTSISNKLFEKENFPVFKKVFIHLLKLIKNKKSAYNFFFCKKKLKLELFNSHSSVKEIESLIHSDIFNNYYKFVIVRNPYDRFVSRFLYFNKIDKKFKYKKFSNFVEWDTQHSKVLHQKSFITKANGQIGVNKIIRFENIYEDFKDVTNTLNLRFEDNTLKKLNSSNNSNYRNFYDDKTKKKVENFSEEDLEYFKYQF